MTIVTRELHEAALTRLAREVEQPRAGILGPDSVAWRLGGDLVVFLGGGRAALLQLAHPMVAYAVEQHSHARSDVLGRFQRTFRAVFAMGFGELDEALAAARRVHNVHTRIHGVMPDGRPYHANDADALRWVHATLVDTVITVRERIAGELPRTVKDRYIVEQQRFAALFGIPDRLWPADWSAHASYMEDMLADLAVAPCAREMAAFLLGRGEGARPPPLGRAAEIITAELLPERLVREFGLVRSPRAARATMRAFAWIGRLPIPARAEAERRLRGKSPSAVDAWMERQLFGLSRRVTGSLSGRARSA